MKNPGVGQRQVFLWVMQICFAASALAGLAGCAANSTSAGLPSAGTDITTESDMTPARQRAQIRLDLAVGYLERNELKVALDEV